MTAKKFGAILLRWIALLYDDDFFAWTQEQAELLRQGSAASNRLDFDLIAEEIEDLGKSELHTVQSLCEHIIEHLLKLEYSGLAEPARHWRREIVEWRVQIAQEVDPQHHRQSWTSPIGIARRCGCCAIWKMTCRGSGRGFRPNAPIRSIRYSAAARRTGFPSRALPDGLTAERFALQRGGRRLDPLLQLRHYVAAAEARRDRVVRIPAMIRPGRFRKLRRPQNRPEFTAAGTSGTSSAWYSAATPG